MFWKVRGESRVYSCISRSKLYENMYSYNAGVMPSFIVEGEQTLNDVATISYPVPQST